MRFNNFLFSLSLIAMAATAVSAQHSDIEFSLDDLDNPTAIIFDADIINEVNIDGYAIFESEFDEPLTGVFRTIDPGFEGAVNPGDVVTIEFLDSSDRSISSVGEGFVSFFNPTTGTLEAGGEVGVLDGFSINSLDLNGGSALGTNPLTVEIGSDIGEAHNHVTFSLGSNPAPGAYGLLAQLDVEGITSDPFFFVFNHQLDEAVFEGQAIPAFLGATSAIPEPATGVLLSGILGSLMLRRRRRS